MDKYKVIDTATGATMRTFPGMKAAVECAGAMDRALGRPRFGVRDMTAEEIAEQLEAEAA